MPPPGVLQQARTAAPTYNSSAQKVAAALPMLKQLAFDSANTADWACVAKPCAPNTTESDPDALLENPPPTVE